MDYEELIRKADEAATDGREDEARRILAAGHEHAVAAGEDGYADMLNTRLRRLAEAQNPGQTARGGIPGAALLYRNIGIRALELGMGDRAIEWFRKSLQSEPQNPDTMRAMGVALSSLGRHEEAIEWFDRAILTDPQDHDSMRQKGVALSELGRHEEAIEWLRKALQIAPQDSHSMRGMGIALSRLGREAEAAEWFDRALEQTSDLAG